MTPIGKLQAMVLLSNEKPGELRSELKARLISEAETRLKMRSMMVGSLYPSILMDEVRQINRWIYQ